MSFHHIFNSTSEKKCVTINLNGEYDAGKVLHMESEWNLHDFLNASSKRLGVASLVRIFNSDGVDIDDCMMIEDNDILFISNGDDFIPPTNSEKFEMDDGSNGAERINGTISGFRIGKMLGRGGFGEVRIGEHHLTGEQVALKFLRKAEIISMGAAERTTTEIQCLSALRHQHIIRLQQQLETPHHVVLVLELMEGGDLFNFLYNRQEIAAAEGNLHSAFDYALPEDEARHVFTQIISAVGYAHNQHICHRDLKLENILLKTKTLECVKIADFGLSAFYRPGALMKSSCGTLSFLAPEVFAGTSNAGPPLDVWAMGVILFALLCGRLPFEGPDLLGTKRPRDAVIQSRISKGQYKIEESLSPEAKDLVRRLLRVDPTVRSSVPEIFSHVWLRSPPGAVTFSVPKPPVSTATPVTPSAIEVKTIEIESVPSSDLFEKVSPPAAASILLSPGGIERQDSRNLIQRRMSDKGLGVERRGSGRGLERGGSERDWDKKDSERGFDSDYCRSKSKSSCGDSEVGHDLITCVPNLDHMSDEDIVSMDLDKITLPSPSYDDDAQHDLPTSNVVDLSNAGNDTVDEMIPLPPPSPSRSGRFSIMNSRENSFSSRYSEITAASKDGLDESEDKNSLHLTLSPRTPPPAASPFVLVPLRRKDVAAEVKHSPRRARSTIPGLEHEEIARYQSSNDCFDYDTNDESLSQHCDVKSKALAGPGSAGASRNTRQSWTDQVDSQKGQENQADKVLSPPGGVSSPRIGGSKFSSPSVCRNKLHIAGSLSLKSHTIGSPANTRHSTSPSPRERTNSRTSRLQDQDGKLSSSPKTSRFNSPSYTSSPDRSGLKGTPPAPSGRASTSYGRKVVRNHGGTGGGGHII